MTDYLIQAKPTQYAGITFRSRLEARWAVFFDALDIPWEYEPERFHLTDGSTYTPDFRLTLRRQEIPDPRHWPTCYPGGVPLFPDGSSETFYAEVKGTQSQLDASAHRITMAVDYGGPCGDGLAILGPIPDPRRGWPVHPHLHHDEGARVTWMFFGALRDGTAEAARQLKSWSHLADVPKRAMLGSKARLARQAGLRYRQDVLVEAIQLQESPGRPAVWAGHDDGSRECLTAPCDLPRFMTQHYRAHFGDAAGRVRRAYDKARNERFGLYPAA
jgi:hypothetical protein